MIVKKNQFKAVIITQHTSLYLNSVRMTVCVVGITHVWRTECGVESLVSCSAGIAMVVVGVSVHIQWFRFQ